MQSHCLTQQNPCPSSPRRTAVSSWLRAGSLSLGTSDVWVRGAWLWGLLGIVGAGWSSTPEASDPQGPGAMWLWLSWKELKSCLGPGIHRFLLWSVGGDIDRLIFGGWQRRAQGRAWGCLGNPIRHAKITRMTLTNNKDSTCSRASSVCSRPGGGDPQRKNLRSS